MNISSREKNILLLAGLVALTFAASTLFPQIKASYQQREDSIEAVLLDISREQRLIEDMLRWRERRVEAEEKTAELEKQIFSGGTVPIVEANIQRALSAFARDSNITVNSTRLAEQLETNGWLMISQEMSFRTTNAGNTVAFLEKLDSSEPRLLVSEFSINRSRNQYSGSITVVGFARSEGLVPVSAD